MPARRNRSTDLSPSGERSRKQRGQAGLSTAQSKPLLEIEPDPHWSPTARMVWDAGIESGQSIFYESSDLAVLHLTCEGFDHWLQQGGRRSPELLRVLMTNLGSLMFSEVDRRKAQVELQKTSADDGAFLASVQDLFAEEDVKRDADDE